MKHILSVPIEWCTAPFNRLWKILLMHLGIALLTAGVVSIIYNFDFVLFYKTTIVYLSSQLTQSFCHIFVYYKLDQRYDWIRDTGKRVLYAIFFHLIVTLGLFFTVLPFTIQLLYGISFTQALAPLLKLWVIPVAATGIALLFNVASRFFKNWKKSFAAEEKLHAQMMNYKYESLRNQINPHFLLESFGALKKLVNADQSRAVMFIQKISNLYRHVLEVKDKEFIPLKEELEYMSLYLDLLKLRYGDQFAVEIDVKAEEDDLIIPLSLQSLIEHAVENNINSDKDQLRINVKREHDHIEVMNSHALRQNAKHTVVLNHAGLKTIEQQYQFYSKKPVQYTETSTTFSVRIPVLKQA